MKPPAAAGHWRRVALGAVVAALGGGALAATAYAAAPTAGKTFFRAVITKEFDRARSNLVQSAARTTRTTGCCW